MKMYQTSEVAVKPLVHIILGSQEALAAGLGIPDPLVMTLESRIHVRGRAC